MESKRLFSTLVFFALMYTGCTQGSCADSDAGVVDAGANNAERRAHDLSKQRGESDRPATQSVPHGRGSPSTDDVPLEAGQEDAPGALVRRSDGAIFCSGTLVADDIVVTAAHCVFESTWSGHPEDAPGAVMDPAGLVFSIGRDTLSPVAWLPVEAIHVHPEVQRTPGDWRRLPSSLGVAHDLAVLVLAHPASELAPDVKPIPIQREDPGPLLGNPVIVGGYGGSGPGVSPDASRRWVTLQFTETNRDYFRLLITGGGFTVAGDSGSGLLISTEGGTRVMGITQGPILPNGEFGSRLDAHTNWLNEFVGNVDDAGAPGPVVGAEPDALVTCGALLECTEACDTDMWCHFDCLVRADIATTAAWSKIGRCQNCAIFGCTGEPTHLACSAECGQKVREFGTPECSECLTQTCQSVEDECRAR